MAAVARSARAAARPFRWTFPRWVIAQALEAAPDGMDARELLRQTRGQGAHPRAAIDALAAAGFIALAERSPRCFLAVLTDAGREALRHERIRRGGRPPTRGPIQPPRDQDGCLVFSYAFEPVATHPPGELWRRTLALLAHIRARRDLPPPSGSVAHAS